MLISAAINWSRAGFIYYLGSRQLIHYIIFFFLVRLETSLVIWAVCVAMCFFCFTGYHYFLFEVWYHNRYERWYRERTRIKCCLNFPSGLKPTTYDKADGYAELLLCTWNRAFMLNLIFRNLTLNVHVVNSITCLIILRASLDWSWDFT